MQAWFKSVMLHKMNPEIKNQNILLVIAHPDDEAMFFVPAIKALRQHNNLYCLCLSSGNYAGLGKIREKELEKSCQYLGFKETPTVVDDPDVQDGPINWPHGVVKDQIHRYFAQHSHL